MLARSLNLSSCATKCDPAPFCRMLFVSTPLMVAELASVAPQSRRPPAIARSTISPAARGLPDFSSTATADFRNGCPMRGRADWACLSLRPRAGALSGGHPAFGRGRRRGLLGGGRVGRRASRHRAVGRAGLGGAPPRPAPGQGGSACRAATKAEGAHCHPGLARLRGRDDRQRRDRRRHQRLRVPRPHLEQAGGRPQDRNRCGVPGVRARPVLAVPYRVAQKRGTGRATGNTKWEGRTRQTFFWKVVHWDPRYTTC